MKTGYDLPTKFRLLISLIAMLFLASNTYAQDNISGRVYEYKSQIPLNNIRVENLRTHAITVSDSSGRFSIKANVKDLLSFSGYSYHADTVYLRNLKSIEIYLELNTNYLKEVKVTGSEIKTGSLKPKPTVTPFGGQTVRYQTDDKLQNKGGISLMLGDYHSNAKKKQKEADLTANDALTTKIATMFSPKNLQNYLPIKGQELNNFIILYIPSVKSYSSNFNLAMYLDSCYKEFNKIPLQDRQSKTYLDLNGKD